jgi:uncharacterized protein (TIGR00725 family)
MAGPRALRIGLIGGNQIPAALYGQAEDVGRRLAKAGALLVCGGMEGAMEAACKGAAAEGGMTIGLLPDATIDRANAFVSLPLATGFGYARNYMIVYNSDAVIAIGGSEGTLNEMAAALNMGLTVVSLKSWPVDKIGTLRRGKILHATTPREAVLWALAAARERAAANAKARPHKAPRA